jgi:hypothetical protein
VGIDLTICPDFGHGLERTVKGEQPREVLIYNRLRADRDPVLYAHVERTAHAYGHTVPLVHWYGDDGVYAEVRHPGSQPLRCVPAEALAEAFTDAKLDQPLSSWNEAIRCLLLSMEPDSLVLLWWS